MRKRKSIEEKENLGKWEQIESLPDFDVNRNFFSVILLYVMISIIQRKAKV